MQFNSSCLILWYVFFFFFLTQYYTQFYNSEQNVVLIRDSMNIFKSRYVKEPFKQAEHMQSETNLYCPKTLTHVACLNLICLFLAILIICRGISTSSAHSGGDFVLLFFFFLSETEVFTLTSGTQDVIQCSSKVVFLSSLHPQMSSSHLCWAKAAQRWKKQSCVMLRRNNIVIRLTCQLCRL